jgi:hypothetical protein
MATLPFYCFSIEDLKSSPLRCCSDISKFFFIMFSLFFGRPQPAAAGKQPVHVTTPCHSEVVVVPMARAGAEAAVVVDPAPVEKRQRRDGRGSNSNSNNSHRGQHRQFK